MSNSIILRNGMIANEFNTFEGDLQVLLINTNKVKKVSKDYFAYHCGQIPFEGYIFKNNIEYTTINGLFAQKYGKINEKNCDTRLSFSID